MRQHDSQLLPPPPSLKYEVAGFLTSPLLETCNNRLVSLSTPIVICWKCLVDNTFTYIFCVYLHDDMVGLNSWLEKIRCGYYYHILFGV
jgi:hypothetical protein